jgi:hypothetical protein
MFSTMSFSSVQPNETKWTAAVEGEPPPLAVPPPLLFEVLAAVYTLLSRSSYAFQLLYHYMRYSPTFFLPATSQHGSLVSERRYLDIRILTMKSRSFGALR